MFCVSCRVQTLMDPVEETDESKSETEVSLPYRKVTDHGLTDVFKLPAIPCSKYTVIGNPKMRVKRDYVHGPPRKRVWKVPKLVQSSLAARKTYEDLSKDAGQDDEVPKGPSKRHVRHARKRGLNPLDKASLYGASSEDSFKGTMDVVSWNKLAEEDIRWTKEREYIDIFYRRRSSGLLDPLKHKGPSHSLPAHLQNTTTTNGPFSNDYLKPSHFESLKASYQLPMAQRRYHSKPCLYCDVAGQMYCKTCNRKYQQIKFNDSVVNSLTLRKSQTRDSCQALPSDNNNSNRKELFNFTNDKREKIATKALPPVVQSVTVKRNTEKTPRTWTKPLNIPRIDFPAAVKLIHNADEK